jgi:hypothetical protein
MALVLGSASLLTISLHYLLLKETNNIIYKKMNFRLSSFFICFAFLVWLLFFLLSFNFNTSALQGDYRDITGGKSPVTQYLAIPLLFMISALPKNIIIRRFVFVIILVVFSMLLVSSDRMTALFYAPAFVILVSGARRYFLIGVFLIGFLFVIIQSSRVGSSGDIYQILLNPRDTLFSSLLIMENSINISYSERLVLFGSFIEHIFFLTSDPYYTQYISNEISTPGGGYIYGYFSLFFGYYALPFLLFFWVFIYILIRIMLKLSFTFTFLLVFIAFFRFVFYGPVFLPKAIIVSLIIIGFMEFLKRAKKNSSYSSRRYT